MDQLINYPTKAHRNVWHKKLLIGVSGGIDSLVLLHYCLQKVAKVEQIFVVHIDHNLRPQSKLDAEFVADFCKSNQVQFCVHKITLPKTNLEAAARKKRYEILQTELTNRGFDLILTAHHQDDQQETIFINWHRGTSWQGLRGINPYDPQAKIWRPFLQIPKIKLYSYARQNKLIYRHDQSNDQTKYLRNQIRHNPKLQEVLKKCLDIVAIAQEKVDYLARNLINSLANSSWQLKENHISTNKAYWRAQPPFIQQQFIRLICLKLKLPLNRSVISELQKQLNYQHNNTKFVHPNATIHFLREITIKAK